MGHEVQDNVVAPVPWAAPPDRRQQAPNHGPVQRPWRQFAAIDPGRIDEIQAGGCLAMLPAIAQEGPQVRDNVLERRAAVLLALELDKGLDVRGCQPRKTALGRQSAGQKVGHRRPVLPERLRRESRAPRQGTGDSDGAAGSARR